MFGKPLACLLTLTQNTTKTSGRSEVVTSRIDT